MPKIPRKAKRPSAWATIKVPRATYDAAHALLERVSAEGWKSIGSARADAPTLGGVFAETFACGVRTIQGT